MSKYSLPSAHTFLEYASEIDEKMQCVFVFNEIFNYLHFMNFYDHDVTLTDNQPIVMLVLYDL